MGLIGIFFYTSNTGGLWRPGSNGVIPAIPRVNSPAANFSLQTLDGKDISLTDLRGKTVLLNFWATWCGPCQIEMPLLQKAQDQYPDRLRVLAINNAEAPELVRAFVNDLGLRADVLLDPDGLVTELFKVRGFPTTIMIDSSGIIRFQHIGILNQSTLNGYLADLGLEP